MTIVDHTSLRQSCTDANWFDISTSIHAQPGVQEITVPGNGFASNIFASSGIQHVSNLHHNILVYYVFVWVEKLLAFNELFLKQPERGAYNQTQNSENIEESFWMQYKISFT